MPVALPAGARLSGRTPYAIPAEAAQWLAAWSGTDPRATTITEAVIQWHYNTCWWRNVVLHRGACVELAGGMLGFVRCLFGGCPAGGGAFLLVECMARLQCPDQYADLHTLHLGVADWGRVGREMERHGFLVLRNRARYSPDGTVDEGAAQHVLVPVADVRALRLTVAYHRWAVLVPWFRREP